MTDIFEVIAKMAHDFKSAGLEPPECVVLKSHDEGVRLMSALHQRRFMTFQAGDPRSAGRPIEHPDGSCFMECEIYGIKVRWPAVKFALKNGGYVWS